MSLSLRFHGWRLESRDPRRGSISSGPTIFNKPVIGAISRSTATWHRMIGLITGQSSTRDDGANQTDNRPVESPWDSRLAPAQSAIVRNRLLSGAGWGLR